MKRRSRGTSFYLILMVGILLLTVYMSNQTREPAVTLFEVEEYIENGDVESILLDGTTLKLTMTEAAVADGKPAQIEKAIPATALDMYLEKFLAAAQDGKIESFDYNQPTDVGGIINLVFLVLLMVSIGAFIYVSYSRQSGDGKSAMSFGRSRAKLNDPGKNKVTFEDVAGAEEEKAELQEVVDFLRNPKKYTELGAKIPRGILLVGAPGTGKTLLARAVAGEAKVPFFSISGSDFVEMFVGVGASRVRDLFNNAKKQAPSIVFIDEIDAVGRQRGAGLGGGHDEREQTLNQLLVEMDGFGPNEGVIVLAATNRPDILDQALLRPGRFDRQIMIMRPDIKGREAILQVHAREKPLADDVDLSEIARITSGFTGADLANLLNEGALMAARKKQSVITYDDISEAVFKVMVGPEKKSRVVSERERKSTAYHEAGHAIILRAVSETDRVERVSIIPAGAAGGYTAWRPNEDLYFKTRRQLIGEIMTGLGGRAAEMLVYNEMSTGAGQDLKQCNAIARNMVTKYGMSERLGNVIIGDDDEVFLGRDYGHTRSHSESLQSVIDEEVARILEESYNKTIALLEKNRVLLDELCEALLEKEKIDSEEFEDIYKRYAVDYKPPPGDKEVEQEHIFSPEEMASTEAKIEDGRGTDNETGTSTLSSSAWLFASN
ncbi:MAG: ATP-dependent zinc metalloprotease FtsH [Saccharofermentanales bacterium]|nr:ATP-dependent zinc metalloprotease FtsH [Eubacteriales bacterium]MDD3611337.1 ATP-dependent zinc metalloprotease FtsH [Eubacteriales bacterium]HHU04721.1 ATP-dependent zinc metalloprotease FtsH [Fastidiosipila sp.]